MIAVVSSSRPERLAFATLFASRSWGASEFESVHGAIRHLSRFLPKVVLVRYKLSDGYSDDIIPKIRQLPGGTDTKVIVLVDAALSSAAEARQLILGADCVLRDPVRTEILAAYVEKFLAIRTRRATSTDSEANQELTIAGARLCVADRNLRLLRKSTRLTPKEAELAESLFHSRGAVIRYEVLYNDVLGRKFAGDTSNMRVLLGKLIASFARVGVSLRKWVEVIPKSGYRLAELSAPAPKSVKGHSRRRRSRRKKPSGTA